MPHKYLSIVPTLKLDMFEKQGVIDALLEPLVLGGHVLATQLPEKTMTSAFSVDCHKEPLPSAGLFALDESEQHSWVDSTTLDPLTHLQINHLLFVPHTPTTEIVTSLSPPFIRPVSGPWPPPSMGITGYPPLSNNGLFAFHFQDFLPTCLSSVPGPDHDLLTSEIMIPVDAVAKGSKWLLGMLSMMPDDALSRSSPGVSNLLLVTVGGPSAPSVSASENETFLQAILDATNIVDMDAANTIDMDTANTIDMNAANTSDMNTLTQKEINLNGKMCTIQLSFVYKMNDIQRAKRHSEWLQRIMKANHTFFYISQALSELLKKDMSTLQILHDKVKEHVKKQTINKNDIIVLNHQVSQAKEATQYAERQLEQWNKDLELQT
ncbi:hypothetical protein HD554DRAFT_2042328 [Boletus coccyginus]|nr:hypothetical protein HD554DRAFT_2042328 [Boletus coccyginus]